MRLERILKGLVSLFLVLLLGSVSGCWDRIEIEERAFIMGAAIDQPSARERKDPSRRWRLTIALPIVREIGGQGGGGGGGGGVSMPLWVTTSTGPSIIAAAQQQQNRINRQLFWGHLQVLALSEETGRHGLRAWTDFFFRSAEIHRRVKLMVVKEKDAGEVLKIKPHVEQLVPMYLRSLLENALQSGYSMKRELGDLAAYLHSDGPGLLLPAVSVAKDEVKTSGAAVLKKDKLVGWLDEKETRGALWLTGEVMGGTLLVAGHAGAPRRGITLRIINARRQVIPVLKKNGEVVFRIKVVVTAEVNEREEEVNLLSLPRLTLLGREAEKVIRGEITRAVKVLQDDYGVDALKFGETLAKKKPEYWEQVKPRWNEYFAQHAAIELAEVCVRVSRMGVMR